MTADTCSIAFKHGLTISALCLVLALSGCATPQQRAITAHCEAEGLRGVPQQLVSQQVMRAVYVGDRTVGSKNTCRTEMRESKDKQGNITKVRETICKDEPIVEPVYQQRLVNEVIDLECDSQTKLCDDMLSRCDGTGDVFKFEISMRCFNKNWLILKFIAVKHD
jgi:hypothetical protein